MRQFRPVLLTCALSAPPAALWGYVAACLGGRADRDSNAMLGVAITVTILAACAATAAMARRASDRRWQALADAVQQDRALLIRTLAAASQRKAPAPTAPIRVR